MRQTESEYWDSVAGSVISPDGTFYDNWSKRRLLAQFLLKCSWSNQRVLEIGVGAGVTAAMLGFSCGNHWDYVGTDLSRTFIHQATTFGLNVVHTDVLHLPEGQFTRIVALDSLEHVRPEDREGGYEAIAHRLAPEGLLFINMPLDKSGHKDEFDHGIGLRDLVRLEDNGLRLMRYEFFNLVNGGVKRSYSFVVMTK